MDKTKTYLCIKTIGGREEEVKDQILDLATKKGLPILSVIVSHKTFQYVFVETSDPNQVKYEIGLGGVRHLRYVVGRISGDEIETYTRKTPVIEFLNVGDEVDVTKGAYHGYKARVVELKRNRGLAIVELLDLSILNKTPVTMDAENLKPQVKNNRNNTTNNVENYPHRPHIDDNGKYISSPKVIVKCSQCGSEFFIIPPIGEPICRLCLLKEKNLDLYFDVVEGRIDISEALSKIW